MNTGIGEGEQDISGKVVFRAGTRAGRNSGYLVLPIMIVAVLGGCANTSPRQSSLEDNPLSKTEIQLSQETSNMIASAPDPAMTIPDDVRIEPAPGSWTAKFSGLVLSLISQDIENNPIVQSVVLVGLTDHALLYGVSGNRDKLPNLLKTVTSFQYSPFAPDSSQHYSKADKECAQPKGEFLDSCALNLEAGAALATLNYLSGNTAEANAIFGKIRLHAPIVRGRAASRAAGEPQLSNQEYDGFYAEYFAHLMLRGDYASAVDILMEKKKLVQKTQVGEFRSVVPFISDLSYSGKQQTYYKLANMISDHRELDGISMLGDMFSQFDGAVVRQERNIVLKSRLKALAGIGGKYTNARQIFRNTLALNLDCRAATIYQSEGRPDIAERLYEKVKPHLLSSQSDIGWELGLCMSRVAQKIGKAADISQISLALEKQRARSSEQYIEKLNELIAVNSEERKKYSTFAMQDTIDRRLAAYEAQKKFAEVKSFPQSPLLSDGNRFRNVVSNALEATKDGRLNSIRGIWLDFLIKLSLEQNRQMGMQ